MIVLRRGSTGDVVRKLQEWLNWWAEVQPKLRLPADGIFGPLTERAVNQVRAARGLPQTGVFDGSVFALGDPRHPATGNLAAAIRSAEMLTPQQQAGWGYTPQPPAGGGNAGPANQPGGLPNPALPNYGLPQTDEQKKKAQEQMLMLVGLGFAFVLVIVLAGD